MRLDNKDLLELDTWTYLHNKLDAEGIKTKYDTLVNYFDELRVINIYFFILFYREKKLKEKKYQTLIKIRNFFFLE